MLQGRGTASCRTREVRHGWCPCPPHFRGIPRPPPESHGGRTDVPSPPPRPTKAAEASESVAGLGDGFSPHPGGTGGVRALPTSAASLVSPPQNHGGCTDVPSLPPRPDETVEASEIVAEPVDGFLPRPGGTGGVGTPPTSTASFALAPQNQGGHTDVSSPPPRPAETVEASESVAGLGGSSSPHPGGTAANYFSVCAG